MVLLDIIHSNSDDNVTVCGALDFFYPAIEASYYAYLDRNTDEFVFLGWHKPGSVSLDGWIKIVSNFNDITNPHKLDSYRKLLCTSSEENNQNKNNQIPTI